MILRRPPSQSLTTIPGVSTSEATAPVELSGIVCLGGARGVSPNIPATWQGCRGVATKRALLSLPPPKTKQKIKSHHSSSSSGQTNFTHPFYRDENYQELDNTKTRFIIRECEALVPIIPSTRKREYRIQ